MSCKGCSVSRGFYSNVPQTGPVTTRKPSSGAGGGIAVLAALLGAAGLAFAMAKSNGNNRKR